MGSLTRLVAGYRLAGIYVPVPPAARVCYPNACSQHPVQGLAMARSFGDAAAESVGVFAEPELTEVQLGSNDKFLIWATDGVWEFISSQEAVEIVAQYLHKSPKEVRVCCDVHDQPYVPLLQSWVHPQACDALVKESTKRWREEEDVVDDTTVIVAFCSY